MDLILILIALGAAIGASYESRAPAAPPPAEAASPAPPPVEPAAPPVEPAAPPVEPAAPPVEPAAPPQFAPRPAAPATQPPPASVMPPLPTFAAEDQAPSGQFTTATEVRPILGATQSSWVALRDYGGQDLVYFTQLLAWRCGLHQIAYAINDEPEQVLETEPCYLGTGQPNAIKAETIQPYITRAPGSVQTVTIRLIYDDLGEDSADFARPAILMP